jgi:hypothetical protein
MHLKLAEAFAGKIKATQRKKQLIRLLFGIF